MASIERREGRKKPYRVHWKDRFTGKARNKSFLLRKQAQAFLESIGAAENILSQSDPNVTVSDALDRWYYLCTTTGRGGREPIEESTAIKYRLHMSQIRKMIGNINLCELTKRDCNDFRDALLEQFSRPYAKKFLTSFKSCLSQAVTDELIIRSPADDTHILISKRQQMANRVPIPELTEIKALTDSIDRLMLSNNQQMRKAWARYGPLFYTLLYSGMRPTEVRGLPWANIDWEANRIQVTQGADDKGVIGLPKSAAAFRTIPLPEFVMKMLKDWQAQCPTSDKNLVFPNGRGNAESLANIKNRGWYPLCKTAKLVFEDSDGKLKSKYPLYALRHTKASLEIALKRSPKHIQTVMGHANIKLTFDTYGHLFEDESLQDDPDDMRKLIDSVAQRLPKEN